MPVGHAIPAVAPGWIRYKVPDLYLSDSLERLREARLLGSDDILYVEANPLTGNVLVLHQGGRSLTQVANRIDQILRQQTSSFSTARCGLSSPSR